jgi:hypothetical protein
VAGTAAGIEEVKVYKGRVSGAAAAIRAYKDSRAGEAGTVPGVAAQQQQQQGSQVRSLASGGTSRPPAHAAAAAAAAGWWGPGAQGSAGQQQYHHQQQQQQQQQQQGESEVLIVPFEFKTGKDYFSHKAQVGNAVESAVVYPC